MSLQQAEAKPTIDFDAVFWKRLAKVAPDKDTDCLGINLVVVTHRAVENDPNDKTVAYEISGPTSIEWLSRTQLTRLVVEEDGRNTEVFMLPVNSRYQVQSRKVKGKRSGKKAMEVYIVFEKGCKEGYDEIILTIPVDNDDGRSASVFVDELEKSAWRVATALDLEAAKEKAVATAVNNSTTSDISDAMVIDQIGSPPTIMLSPDPNVFNSVVRPASSPFVGYRKPATPATLKF